MKIFSLIGFMLVISTGVYAQFIKAVPTLNTAASAMTYLKGAATYDPLSKNYISYKWFLQSGQKAGINIESDSSVSTRVSGLVPGTYQFGFIVSDRRLKMADTSYMTVTVKKP